MIPEHKYFYTILFTLIITYFIANYIKISPITSQIILPLIIFIILILVFNKKTEPYNNYNKILINDNNSINKEIDNDNIKKKKTYIIEDLSGLDETDKTDTINVTELFSRNNIVKIYENNENVNY